MPDLQPPVFSSWLGWLTLLFVIGLNGAVAFLGFLSYNLRARGWPVVAGAFACSALLNLGFPLLGARSGQGGQPFTPADTIPLAILLIGLIAGLRGLHTRLKTKRRGHT